MTIRIEVDRDLCQGHGVCENEASEVFEVGTDHQVVVHQESLGAEQRGAVDMAVKYCPTHALGIIDD